MADTNQLMWFFSSYLGVNPSQGCTNGCAYCILDKDVPNPHQITRKETAKFTLDTIITDERVSKTNPLAFYNLSDPFLKRNVTDLLYVLEGLEQKEHKNIAVLITKLNPDRTAPEQKALERIAKLKNIKPVLMISYANLPKEIEPVSASARIELMAKTKELGIPTVQYARPLWETWTPMDKVQEMAEKTAPLVNSVVIGGIVTTPGIKEKLEKRGVAVPPWGNEAGRYLDERYSKRIVDAYKSKNPDIGVFVNSSCGISHALRIPNYMGYYWHFSSKSPTGYCQRFCHPDQRERCNGGEQPVRSTENLSREEAEKEMAKIQQWMDRFKASRAYFMPKEGYLEMFARVQEQEIRMLSQHLGVFIYTPANFKLFGHKPKF